MLTSILCALLCAFFAVRYWRTLLFSALVIFTGLALIGLIVTTGAFIH